MTTPTTMIQGTSATIPNNMYFLVGSISIMSFQRLAIGLPELSGADGAVDGNDDGAILGAGDADGDADGDDDTLGAGDTDGKVSVGANKIEESSVGTETKSCSEACTVPARSVLRRRRNPLIMVAFFILLDCCCLVCFTVFLFCEIEVVLMDWSRDMPVVFGSFALKRNSKLEVFKHP